MIQNDTEPPSENSFFGELMQIGAQDVIQSLERYSSLLGDGGSRAWLKLAGGFSLHGAGTDMELLYLAQTAPNELLFGLAYGKYVDAIATRPHQNALGNSQQTRFVDGLGNGVLTNLRDNVLARGFSLEIKAEEEQGSDSDFFEQDCMLCQSRSPVAELIAQLQRARSAFTTGQILSWLITALQACQPVSDEEGAQMASAKNDESFYDQPSYAITAGMI